MKRSAPFAAMAVAAIVLGACGGGLQPVDPTQALRDGAAAMGKLTTLSANLKVIKGTITFQGFALVGAKSVVRLPGDSDTTYTVKEQDISIGLEVIISGGHVYLRLPFVPFQELTGHQAEAIPNLAKLFDPSTGLPAVIPAGTSPKYIAVDRVDGIDSHEVQATYTAAQFHSMLPQLTSSGEVTAVLWVGGSDHLIRKAVLSGPFADNGADGRVEVDMSGFNAAVSIASPTP